MPVDPITMAVVSLTTTVIGTGVQAYAANQQGKARQKLAENNALQQQQDAIVAQEEARAQSAEIYGDMERIKGKQRKAVGKSGVEFIGAPLDAMAESVMDMKMQALEVERQGDFKAKQLTRGAAISRYEGKQARKAGKYQAYGTILQGASKFGGDYANFSKTVFKS